MKYLIVLCIFIIALAKLNCEIVPIFYEKLDYCVDDNERAGFIDFSNFKIHVENDTHSYINGTWKFLHDVNTPWVYNMFAERYNRGQWIIEVFNRKIADFCAELHNKVQPWNYVFEKVPGCPIMAGSEWNFDMIHLKLPSAIPSHFAGKWRFTQSMDFVVDGIVNKKECNRVYFDFFDE